jgi:hypothetical protein
MHNSEGPTQPPLKLGVTKYLVGPPHPPSQTLRHFQITLEVNFWYVTIFSPN